MLRSPLFWTPRKLAFHALMLLVVVVCLGLGYWQLQRGEAGNLRSYAYAIEWPFFACAAAYMWWRTMREDIAEQLNPEPDQNTDPATEQPPSLPASRVSRVEAEAEPDPELDAYNAYLADLDRAAAAKSR